MMYLPKPKLTLNEQYQLNTKSKAFKDFAHQQLTKMQHHYFAADFECTTTQPYTVYMVTIEDIHTHEQWFYHSIDEFLAFCERYPNSTFYFHNGENYDFEFIINRVLQDDNWEFHYSREMAIKRRLPEFELTTKGTDIKNRQSKDKQPKLLQAHIRLKDTTNIFTTSLSQLGKTIGYDKGLGEIDTPLVARIFEDNSWVEQGQDNTGFVYHQYSDYRVDFLKFGWWLYAMQDTHILAEVIRYYDIIEHSEENENTAAKISYNAMLKQTPVYKNKVKMMQQRMQINDLKDRMTVLNKYAKRAYKGGIAWANPAYTDQLLTNVEGYHLDYNSMYPSIYMDNKSYPLPENRPSYDESDLYIIHYTNLKARCPLNKFPLLKERTQDMDNNELNHHNSKYYLHTFEGDITITSVEDEYLHKHYQDISYDNVSITYYQRNEELEQALVNHGKIWYEEKVEGSRTKDEGRKMYAKMQLNTVYGYLGFFNKLVDLYDYTIENGETIKTKRDNDREQHAVLGLPHAEVPAASFITAYGRVKLAEDINKIGVRNVICCDTDSLFVINVDWNKLNSLVEIDSDKLGALDCEHTFTQIRAIKAKTWCIANDDYQATAQATAGSNYKFKDIRNFKYGQQFLSTVKVRGKGGIGIKEMVKELGEPDITIQQDYEEQIRQAE